MALRLIEATFPQSKIPDLDSVLTGHELLDLTYDPVQGDKVQARILLPAEQTEAVLDILEQRYGGLEGFRAMLFPVEATIPRYDPEKQPAVSARLRGKKKAGRERISREELYAQISDAAKLNRSYAVMVVLSTIVAGIGILRDNTAIIIGAMVIAPLLGPMVATAFATTLGDAELMRRATKTGLVGFMVALVIAIGWGAIGYADPQAPELLNRTDVALGDVVLALASGSAGVLSFTMGASSALVGVMVAVALLPPLVTVGLLLGAGNAPAAGAAFVVFATNIICVNLAGIITFMVQGIRPLNWWEHARAQQATRQALKMWSTLLLGLIVIILIIRYFSQ